MKYPKKSFSINILILFAILLLTTFLFADKKATIIFTGSNNGYYRDCG